jgi:hypothetical protein
MPLCPRLIPKPLCAKQRDIVANVRKTLAPEAMLPPVLIAVRGGAEGVRDGPLRKHPCCRRPGAFAQRPVDDLTRPPRQGQGKLTLPGGYQMPGQT